MSRWLNYLLTAGVALLSSWASNSAATAPIQPAIPPQTLPDLGRAAWVWHGGSEPLCHFRKTFALDERPSAAAILITADNGYELFVNGSLVGSDIGADSLIWQSVELYNLEALLRPGLNVIAVRATDLGGIAGLLAAARVEFAAQDATPARSIDFATDASWRVTANTDPTGFALADFVEGPGWHASRVLGLNGTAPWGRLAFPGPVSPGLTIVGAGYAGFLSPDAEYSWPAGILFLRGRAPETSTPAEQAIWRINDSRAYLEMDILGPSMPGRALYTLRPATPTNHPALLLDAGTGLIGSPRVSFDGETIYFSYAPAGEKFWQIYSLPAAGGAPVAITSGPFHDFDPEPLPDGRIVFSSTRIGTREEYHGNAARSLFVMHADGSGIRPITQHIVGDMEPRVLANGNVAFVRQDNFFERAKVETHIHSVRPDGSAGQILLGPSRGALAHDRAHAAEEDGRWLRSYGFGSPAPLPDGRLAAISSYGIVISGNETQPSVTMRPSVGAVDISPLPDGRLLFTSAGCRALGVMDTSTGGAVKLLDSLVFPSSADAARSPSIGSPGSELHSVVFLGPRARPPVLRETVDPATDRRTDNTGFLVCQDVRISKQTNAELSRIKAIRVLEGRPFALRSAKHQYAHIGVEAVELGTVPLAPDGSFFVEVPADRALSLQAVDAQGRTVINELSWIYVRPGERRSCTGCHSEREAAPPTGRGILALRGEAVKLLGKGDPHRFRGNNAANGGVLNLQFDRFREAASINLHSKGLDAQPAGAPGRSSELARLASRLSSPSHSPALRSSAAQHLAVFRDGTAAPALSAALRDPDPDVRLNAALALASCGRRESVPALLDALHDPVSAVAQAAHLALTSLTAHEQPFNAYATAAERETGITAWRTFFSAHAWARIEQGLIQRLSRQIGSGQKGEQESGQADDLQDVLAALGSTGSDAARKALRQLVAGEPALDLRVMMAALGALGQLRDQAAVPLLSDWLMRSLPKQHPPPAGNHEFGFTQRQTQIAGAAAEALGRIGSPAAEANLLAAAEMLAEFWYYTYQTGDHDWLMGCNASVPHFRIFEALDALGSKNTARIVPVVLRSLPIDPDRALLFETDAYETVSARIVQRSGLAGQVVELCLDVLEHGEAQDCASSAPGDLSLIAELKAAVTASPPAVTVLPFDPPTRAAQLLSIICNSQDAAGRIRQALDHYRAQPPSRTRSWTCFYLARALGKLGGEAAIDSLVAVLECDPPEASFGRFDPPHMQLFVAMSPYYRAAAASSLGLIGNRSAMPVLAKTIQDFDNAPDVRHAAARALGMLAKPSDLPMLEKLAADYPELYTRRALLAACEELR